MTASTQQPETARDHYKKEVQPTDVVDDDSTKELLAEIAQLATALKIALDGRDVDTAGKMLTSVHVWNCLYENIPHQFAPGASHPSGAANQYYQDLLEIGARLMVRCDQATKQQRFLAKDTEGVEWEYRMFADTLERRPRLFGPEGRRWGRVADFYFQTMSPNELRVIAECIEISTHEGIIW